MTNKPTILLERMPDEPEVEMVMAFADKRCECTEQMKAGLEVNGEQVMCRPCAARQILNGVATFNDTL